MKAKPVPPSIPEEKIEEDKIEAEILRALPKNLKQRGKLLIDKIKEHPDVMKWDQRGQLIYQDQPLTGSHVVDLVGDMLRPRKGFDPVGWETFAQGLAKMNTPEDLVRNQARRVVVRNYKSGGKQYETPQFTFPSSVGPVRNTRNATKHRRQGRRWLNFNA